MTNRSDTSVLWPIYRHRNIREAGVVHNDWSVAPLFHRTTVRPDPEQEADTNAPPREARSYTRFWPLFSIVDENGGRFVRVLDFSLQRRVGALERNLLQMPVLYTHGVRDDLREDELLWGLFRWRRDDERTQEFQIWPFFRRERREEQEDAEWSILFGLLGGENGDDGRRRTRLLWFLTF